MAVTAPVFRKNSQDLIGEVRFVTSLKLLDRQVGQIYLMLAGAALAVLLLLTVTNQFFIHSIVNPVLKINELAQKIAQGQYGARLDMDFRDEMGELCNTINNMSTEIARMEKLKNDFISSVSHELRTPLTAIGGWAETVENNLDDKNTVETGLDIIRKETTRLSRMVEELLDFSRLESGRMKLQTEVLDLRGEVYDALFVYNEMKPAITNLLSRCMSAATGIGCARCSSISSTTPQNMASAAARWRSPSVWRNKAPWCVSGTMARAFPPMSCRWSRKNSSRAAPAREGPASVWPCAMRSWPCTTALWILTVFMGRAPR